MSWKCWNCSSASVPGSDGCLCIVKMHRPQTTPQGLCVRHGQCRLLFGEDTACMYEV